MTANQKPITITVVYPASENSENKDAFTKFGHIVMKKTPKLGSKVGCVSISIPAVRRIYSIEATVLDSMMR